MKLIRQFNHFPDGRSVRDVETGEEFACGERESLASICRRCPDVVAVDANHVAHGGGMDVYCGDESYWLPAPLVRGHRGATNEELEAAPAWARFAYERLWT